MKLWRGKEEAMSQKTGIDFGVIIVGAGPAGILIKKYAAKK